MKISSASAMSGIGPHSSRAASLPLTLATSDEYLPLQVTDKKKMAAQRRADLPKVTTLVKWHGFKARDLFSFV